MSLAHSNISIFVPHIGCPNKCSFCDQRHITGVCKAPREKDVAKAVNVTPNYLSGQFKKETSGTISDYIRQRRIDTAVRLLNTTDLTIQEIGERVGIGETSYFSRQFKAVIGMSPMEYRKMVHGQDDEKVSESENHS